ncbi:MAG: TIGR00269 family protein [Candidatus Pacearchaeota archaeon]|nr:TIGR00269 family protein [Candidatus Pacearchaeota archaeon]
MNLERQVINALKRIKLQKKKKILVALSGGKDSTLTAYLLKKFGYNICGIHIDLKIGKYSDDCKRAVEKLCNDLGIELYIYDIKEEMGSGMCFLRSSIQSKKSLKNCAICGVIKKWILNKEARKLKVDKIATGHHLDDEIQTFILNILKGSPSLSANSGVLTRNVKDKKFIPRIKPLYYVLENDIRDYTKKKNLPVVYEKCPCAIDSYRIQIRKFLEKLSEKEKKNIMNNFEKISTKIKKKNVKMNYCEVCGEPTRKKICKKCELMKLN